MKTSGLARTMLIVGAVVFMIAVLWALTGSGDADRSARDNAPAMLFGVNAGYLERSGAADAAALQSEFARHEFLIGTPLKTLRAVVADHARHDVKVLLLAGFPGSMPTVQEARSLGRWAREFGPGGDFWSARPELDPGLAVTEIEFGNETSATYQYDDAFTDPSYVQRARDYALRFAEARDAIAEANPDVGLLAQADDGGSKSSVWVDTMAQAVPNLDELAAGWVIHPYGPDWSAKLDRLVDQTKAAGWSAQVPIWITEFGLATDNGRCLTDNYGWDSCMTYADAASTLETVVDGAAAQLGERLRAVALYQARDQRPPATSDEREHYFGALRSDGSRKGAYTTAVRRLANRP